MKFTTEARAQVAALRRHYQAKGRPEAARNLTRTLRQAALDIAAGKVVPTPVPYPDLVQTDRAWTHVGRHWFRHTTATPTLIIGVFYDEANIPGRLD